MIADGLITVVKEVGISVVKVKSKSFICGLDSYSMLQDCLLIPSNDN